MFKWILVFSKEVVGVKIVKLKVEKEVFDCKQKVDFEVLKNLEDNFQ